jgi:hypothetical protein
MKIRKWVIASVIILFTPLESRRLSNGVYLDHCNNRGLWLVEVFFDGWIEKLEEA